MSDQDAGERKRMQSVGQYTRSARLMNHMAATRGIDLQQGVARDEIRVGALVCAVTRCAACTGQEQCVLWLAAQGDRKAAATPDYCENSEFLARLLPEDEDDVAYETEGEE